MAIKINADKLLLRLHEEFNRNVSDTYNGGIKYCIETVNIMIQNKRLKISNCIEKPHKITETCTFCENAVTLYWDTKHDGYEIYCPCCGKQMTLKDAYYREVTAKEQELK